MKRPPRRDRPFGLPVKPENWLVHTAPVRKFTPEEIKQYEQALAERDRRGS